MKTTFGFPYVPFYPMGPGVLDELYNPSMSFRGQSSGGFGGIPDFSDLQLPQLQQDSLLGSKRKVKEEADNESPESVTGNGPRLQRPTPKAPGNYSLANPGKNFEPASLNTANSLSSPQPGLNKMSYSGRAQQSTFDASVLNNLQMTRGIPSLFGDGLDMDQGGVFGKGSSGFSQMFKGSSNTTMLGRSGYGSGIPPNINSP